MAKVIRVVDQFLFVLINISDLLYYNFLELRSVEKTFSMFLNNVGLNVGLKHGIFHIQFKNKIFTEFEIYE